MPVHPTVSVPSRPRTKLGIGSPDNQSCLTRWLRFISPSSRFACLAARLENSRNRRFRSTSPARVSSILLATDWEVAVGLTVVTSIYNYFTPDDLENWLSSSPFGTAPDKGHTPEKQ